MPLPQIQVIPLARIRPMPHQPRRVITQEAIDLMAASLTLIGQEDPVKVRPSPTGGSPARPLCYKES